MFAMALVYMNPITPSGGLLWKYNPGEAYLCCAIPDRGIVAFASLSLPYISMEGSPTFVSFSAFYGKGTFGGGLRLNSLYTDFYREGRMNADVFLDLFSAGARLKDLLLGVLPGIQHFYLTLSPAVVFRSLSLDNEYLKMEPLKASSVLGLSVDISVSYRGENSLGSVVVGNIFSSDVGFIQQERLEPFVKGAVGYRLPVAGALWLSASAFADRWGVSGEGGLFWSFLESSASSFPLQGALFLRSSFSDAGMGFVLSFFKLRVAYSLAYRFSVEEIGHLFSLEVGL